MISNVRASFRDLDPRERDVLALVSAGLMNKQIAAELGIAEITVKIHRGHIMKKMRCEVVGRFAESSPKCSVSVAPNSCALKPRRSGLAMLTTIAALFDSSSAPPISLSALVR